MIIGTNLSFTSNLSATARYNDVTVKVTSRLYCSDGYLTVETDDCRVLKS